MCLLALGPSLLHAQNDSATLDDLLRSAQQWANDNLDDNALRMLQSVDQEKAKKLLADLQRQFQGEYVIDLAQLKEGAVTVLPLLEQYEETLPYAIWIRSRLDYLDVAEQFRLIIPPPKAEPGKPPVHPPNPEPKLERQVWIKKLEQRPAPKTANPYVAKLKPIFLAQQVPAELIWVAEVESSFDPRARSPSGAAGLFQLMPATAKRFGLKTWPIDQRLKPEASAGAAAKYLHALHAHYCDWRLTLAAYNAGEGTVDKLLAGRKTRTFDAIATRLPAETQMYVPRVEATILRREGLRMDQLLVR
jgi:membrane-bound lytic murein transglycosylase D